MSLKLQVIKNTVLIKRFIPFAQVVFNVSLLAVVLLVSSDDVYAEQEQIAEDSLLFGIVAEVNSDKPLSESVSPFFKINLDYLDNIFLALGLHYQLKAYPSIDVLLDAVEQGEVDGTIGLSQTEKRQKRFLFSNPVFRAQAYSWYRDASLADIPADELRWACVKGSTDCEQLTKQGIDNIYLVQNVQQAFEAVYASNADVLSGSYVGISEFLERNNEMNGLVVKPKWSRFDDARLLVNKQHQWLVDKVNEVLLWEQQGLNVRSIASKNRYHISSNTLLAFQKRYGADVPITYSINDSRYPFLYESDGDLEGFLPDLFQFLRSRTGLNFQYVAPEEHLSGGFNPFTADLVIVAYTNPKPHLDWGVTIPFMSSKFISMELAKQSATGASTAKIGVLVSGVKNQGATVLMSNDLNQYQRYQDIQTLIADVKSGEVAAAYLPKKVALSFIAQDTFSDMDFGQQPPLLINLAFAVNPQKSELLKLMNSILSFVNKDDVDRLYRPYRHFSLVYGVDSQRLTQWILSAVAVFVVLLALTYLVVKHLQLKIRLAEANADNEERGKQWLENIINEVQSLIFISDEKDSIILSNCYQYRSGKCRHCSLLQQASRYPQKQIAVKNLFDPTDSDPKDSDLKNKAQACGLGLEHVWYEHKKISSPVSGQEFSLAVLHDISQLKQKELALEKANIEARSGIKARERFLATMSHELRTPISAVHGILDLVRSPSYLVDQEDLLEKAAASIQHLNRLVDEILDFSKLQEGHLDIDNRCVEIKPVLQQTISSFEAQAKAKGLSFLIQIDDSADGCFYLDSQRLVQIVSNLISNAMKFTSEGFVRTHIYVQAERLILEIEDSGIGMKPSQIEAVRSPFVQADDSVTRRFGGTGLGLSIVDKLLEKMGGQLVISSEFSIGTTMTVSLPATLPNDLAEDVTTEQQTEWFVGHDSPLGVQADVNLSINQEFEPLDVVALVAEDSPINQDILCIQLAQFGIKAVAVNNGSEAWKHLSQHPDTQLLVTDYHMPVLDGSQLVERIASDDRFTQLLVIGITAEDPRHDNTFCQNERLNEVIYKPYTLVQLYQVIKKHLPLPSPQNHSQQSQGLSQPLHNQSHQWLAQYSAEEQQQICEVFNATMGEDIKQLQSQSNTAERRKVIHRIKGAAGALAIQSIVAACLAAEQASQQEFDSRCNELIQCIALEIDHLESRVGCHV
ncbi:ATP-binding protein [Vibrio hippocampi]|uniref:histidine kinase n=1 Tax=Vibrio hippocampi TaxID=654686 RepID=A0ABM8ZN74_9VIBR|nr:transporter substrate-binding domain-containing protein [Vibrio hippocampi]CAH0530034.1 Sensor protein EvgS [Vibrio hippocampi]